MKTKSIIVTICLCIILSLNAFASSFDYDISDKSEIDEETIETEVNMMYEMKQEMEGDFSVASYDLEKAYVYAPLEYMINGHKNGMTFEKMTYDYKVLLVPIKSKTERDGYLAFRCDTTGMTYNEMAVAQEGEMAKMIDMSIVEECCEDIDAVKDINIYKSGAYGMYMAVVDTEGDRYVIPYAGGAYEEYGIEDYSIHTENEFWQLMDSVFDETSLDPNKYGGVKIRPGVAKSGDDNVVILYAILAMGAFAGMWLCVKRIKWLSAEN